MFDTIYLHAGLPKTGSTYLQNSMEILSKSGLLQRVAYPVLDAAEDFSHIGSGNGVELSKAAMLPIVTELGRNRLEADFLALVEASESSAENLLISCEQFFLASIDGFAALREMLLRHARSVKLIVCVRPLRDWTCSVYAQHVKGNASSQDYDEQWLDGYGSSLARFFQNMDTFDVDAVTFKYAESGLLPKFLGIIGENEQLAARLPELRVNRSLSEEELSLLRRVNAYFNNPALSRKISADFVRKWPGVEVARFPAEREFHFQQFARKFAAALSALSSPLMASIRQDLFSDESSGRPSAKPQAPKPDYVLEVVLENIRDLLDSSVRDANAYSRLRGYADGMDKGRDFFDPVHYLLMHRDILDSGADPWNHYQANGRSEGRPSHLVTKGLK